MRKGMVGLSMLVQQTLAEDPFICVARDYVAASPSGVCGCGWAEPPHNLDALQEMQYRVFWLEPGG
jgi:hypothetical protein